MLREFAVRTGLPRPTIGVGGTNPQILQMIGLLNEELAELVPQYEWSQLQDIATFTTVAAQNQGDLVTLAGKNVDKIVNDTLWNGSTRIPLAGPTSQQDWTRMRVMDAASPLYSYRIRAGNLYLFPTPAAGVPITFEFINRRPVVIAETGNRKERFTLDTDTSVFPDELLIAALRWRWKREKGFVFGEEKSRYEQMRDALKQSDATKGSLSLNRPDILRCGQEWPKFLVTGVPAVPSTSIENIYWGYSADANLVDIAGELTLAQRVRTGDYLFAGAAAARYLYIALPTPYDDPFVFEGFPVVFVSNFVPGYVTYRSQFPQNGSDLTVTIP